MARLSLAAEIAAPPVRVFAAFTDFERTAEHITAVKRVEVLTDGPVGTGTRLRETRVMFGRETTEEMLITAFDPPRTCTVEATSCGSHWRSTFCFEPTGTGATRIDFEMQITPVSLFARLMSPLAGLMMKPMRRCMENDIADFKRFCESPQQAANSQPA